MKNCFFICFLLLISCGSPFDEGYWKEHNRVADIVPDDGEERVFDITFERVNQNLDIEFSGESFRRLADQRVSLSVEFSHPAGLNITEFRIRNTPCAPVSGPTSAPRDQDSTFSRNSVPLSQVSDDVNRNLETQFIYLRGNLSSGTVLTDIACAPITL